MIDNDINFHLIYYLSSPPHTVRTSGKCSYALPFCRMGTPPVHIACILRKWIHAGDLLFWLGRCCWCANSPCQSRKCSTHSGLCITSFCLVCLVQVVVARLLVRMALIDWLQRKALVCLCCHVLFHFGLVCYRSHIQLRGQILLRVFQWCPILQIVVLGCCTPVDNGVVLGAGRLVGGHVERSGGLLVPARRGLLSSSPFGWWCLVVVDGVDLCLRQAAEEMRLFVLRAHWLIPSSSWRASPCVMWWYWQWYWLYCCWTSHSSWSRQNDYSVRTPLVQMWQFPKLGVVGMPLGYGGVDWSTDLWTLPITHDEVVKTTQESLSECAQKDCATKRTQQQFGPSLNHSQRNPIVESAGFSYACTTKINNMKFAHQSFCNPPIAFFFKAIKAGFLKGTPHLDAHTGHKYLIASLVTAKGHLKQPRKGIWSTTPKPTMTPRMLLSTPARAHNTTMPGLIQPEEYDNLPNHPPHNKINDIEDKSIANVFCFGAFANKVTGIIYNDCTGDFPYMSLDGNVCFFVKCIITKWMPS